MALPRVLVLDGHTTQALACVRSLGRAGYPVLVASHRRWPLASWSGYARASFRTRGETVADFAELREWAHRRGTDIVLPVTERSCFLCNVEAAAWTRLGMTLGCDSNEMLMPAFDKARTIERAVASGINVPPTRLPDSLDGYRAAVRELGLPCVIKPRFSNAWEGGRFLPDRGIGYVRTIEDLERAVLARKQGDLWPLIQRYVGGQGKGVFTICDRGRPLAWFAHERLRDVRPSGSGSSLRRSIPLHPLLREQAERLLSDLAWHGPAMFEFRDDGVNEPWLMEINGRFWGSLQLAISAGADFPVQWVRLLSGEPVNPNTTYRAGVTVRWLWGDVKRLLNIMQGPPGSYPGTYPRLRQGLRELLGRQPPGTRLEAWDLRDPWPAVAEWVQGLGELLGGLLPERELPRITPSIPEAKRFPDARVDHRPLP